MPITLYLPPDGHEAAIRAVKRTRRVQVYVLPQISGGVLLFMALSVVVLSMANHLPRALLYALFPGVLGLFYVCQPLWFTPLLRRRLARVPNEPRTVTISPDGIAVAAVTSSARFDWSNVTSVVETDGLFILRRRRLIALVLPKSVFSATDLEAFRALLAGRHLIPA